MSEIMDPLVPYALYSDAGEIIQVGHCTMSHLSLQAASGRSVICGEATCNNHYFSDGQIVAFSGAELSVKNSLPRGWTWKMPERIAIDLRSQAQQVEDTLQAILDKRKAEYPALTDLADALYWQSEGDASKMNKYLEAVQAVKLKYPLTQAL